MIKLILFLFIAPLSVIAQIKVSDPISTEKIGEAKVSGFKFMECYKRDSVYVFRYKDMRYTQIDEWKSFAFIDMDDAFNGFYNIVVSVLDTGEGVDIEVPNGKVSVSPKKVFGKTRVEFLHTNDAGVTGITNNFNRKQIDTLFGK